MCAFSEFHAVFRAPPKSSQLTRRSTATTHLLEDYQIPAVNESTAYGIRRKTQNPCMQKEKKEHRK